ncbi:hypothetical protein [Nostoc sp.]|uniref:hypothetical protein n=1 Tax=Nostoc sp. TaxID=1180 RepID=UPI002FF550B4
MEPADPRTRKLSKIRILLQIDWGLGKVGPPLGIRGNGEWGLGTGMGEQSTMPHAPAKQSSTKISNNSVVQALHLKEIYVAPSALGVVYQ